jgi:hypothetical protein
MAGWTRLELATSDVTGRRSNQLNYHPVRKAHDFTFASGIVKKQIEKTFPRDAICAYVRDSNNFSHLQTQD